VCVRTCDEIYIYIERERERGPTYRTDRGQEQVSDTLDCVTDWEREDGGKRENNST